MAKSPYEERILEELRIIHAKEEMLYRILQEVKSKKKPEERKESK